jgi:hypothetical protein
VNSVGDRNGPDHPAVTRRIVPDPVKPAKAAHEIKLSPPVPGYQAKVQYTVTSDGKAESANPATLTYTWIHYVSTDARYSSMPSRSVQVAMSSNGACPHCQCTKWEPASGRFKPDDPRELRTCMRCECHFACMKPAPLDVRVGDVWEMPPHGKCAVLWATDEKVMFATVVRSGFVVHRYDPRWKAAKLVSRKGGEEVFKLGDRVRLAGTNAEAEIVGVYMSRKDMFSVRFADEMGCVIERAYLARDLERIT